MARSPGVSVAGSISWSTRSGVVRVRVVFMPLPVLHDTTRACAGPSASGYGCAALHLLGQSLRRPGTGEARIVWDRFLGRRYGSRLAWGVTRRWASGWNLPRPA